MGRPNGAVSEAARPRVPWPRARRAGVGEYPHWLGSRSATRASSDRGPCRPRSQGRVVMLLPMSPDRARCSCSASRASTRCTSAACSCSSRPTAPTRSTCAADVRGRHRRGRSRAAVPEAAAPLDHRLGQWGWEADQALRPRAPRAAQRAAAARPRPRTARPVLAAALHAARPAPPAVGDAPDRGAGRTAATPPTSRCTTRSSTGCPRCGCSAGR